MDRIREALVDYWGEQCPDYDPDCTCCQAWAELSNAESARSNFLIMQGSAANILGKLEKVRAAALLLADWAEHEVGVDVELTPGLADLRRLL